jgi:hypothetical protein
MLSPNTDIVGEKAAIIAFWGLSNAEVSLGEAASLFNLLLLLLLLLRYP